jgi:hypothetical protein
MTRMTDAERLGALRRHSPSPEVPATQAAVAEVVVGRVVNDASAPRVVPWLLDAVTR